MNKDELKQTIALYDDLLDTKDYLRIMGYDGVYDNRDFKICCPIHEEKEPSFSYSNKMGIWTCFGACHTSGRVVKLHYMLLQKKFGEKLSIVHALEDLYSLFPYMLPKIENRRDIVNNDNAETRFLKSMQRYNNKQVIKPKIISNSIEINDYLLLEFTRQYRDQLEKGDWK